MTKEFDQKLVEKYPKIFANRFGDMKTTAMCWGFECGDGWYYLIEDLCSSIQWRIDQSIKENSSDIERNNIIIAAQNRDFTKFDEQYKIYSSEFVKQEKENIQNMKILEPRKIIPQVVATQVKEKFGGLRFYITGGDEKIDAFISFTESLSYKICDTCSSMKDVGQTQGWYKTICKTCWLKPDIKLVYWKQNDTDIVYKKEIDKIIGETTLNE